MKHSTILLLSIFLFTFSTAQERSNSEIKRDFEKEYKALLKTITSAATTEEIAQAGETVNAFEAQYKPYQEFLNKALYPDDFDASIEKLKASFTYSEQKIKAIGESAARIAELEQQVTTLTEQVNSLNGENASLLAKLKEATAERDSLLKVVSTLRTNLAKRDKAIFALVDSLFMQYDKNIQPTGDVQQSKQAKLERSSVLSNVKRAVADNVEFLSSTQLSGNDVASLYGEQRKFESNWNGIKKLVGDAYLSNKEKAREIPTIDTMIAQWHTKVDESFWKSLNAMFADAKLSVSPINNGSEIYPAIARYLDDQITKAGQKSETDPYAEYQVFEKIWTESLKPIWVPVWRQNNMMTDAQAADIDTKVQLWYSKVKPSNWLIYTLVGLIVLAVAYILYGKMKSKPKVA
jgi:hypothetical protein